MCICTTMLLPSHAAQIQDGQVVIHQGLSTAELAKFPDMYFDWVYLDTSHDYESTRQELELCRAKVKANGSLTGHDYVTGYWVGHCRYGVIEAVHAFCIQYDWEMIYLTHETHRHLSFVIQPMPINNPKTNVMKAVNPLCTVILLPCLYSSLPVRPLGRCPS